MRGGLGRETEGETWRGGEGASGSDDDEKM